MIMNNENGIYDKEIEEYYCHEISDILVNLGYGLIPLVDKEKCDLLERISISRKETSELTGIPIPKIHITDDKKLNKYEYSILLRDVEVGRWTFKKNYALFIETGEQSLSKINESWEKTKEPTFGMDAYFVPEEEAASLEQKKGLMFISPSVVISTHLKEIILRNRKKFLNHYYVRSLVDRVRWKNPDLVSELFLMKKFTMTDLKIILNRLISENVSIKDMNTILETVAEYLKDEDKPLQLAEKVRERLALLNLQKYADQKKVLHVIRISQPASETLENSIYFPLPKVEMPYFALDPNDNKKFRNAVEKYVVDMTEKDMPQIFLCVSSIRLAFAEYLEKNFPSALCVSDREIYALNYALEVCIEGELYLDDDKE